MKKSKIFLLSKYRTCRGKYVLTYNLWFKGRLNLTRLDLIPVNSPEEKIIMIKKDDNNMKGMIEL